MFTDHKWIELNLPKPENVDAFCAFIHERLVPAKIEALLLLVSYQFRFPSHPECVMRDPISPADARKIGDACRSAGIRLVPMMNFFGHQSPTPGDPDGGVLVPYPQFDESADIDQLPHYRSFCPQSEGLLPILYDLMDDVIDAFDVCDFHIGCDEVFEIAHCEKCRSIAPAKLFADWITKLHTHLSARGVTVHMWGDRLLPASDYNGHKWSASANNTEDAMTMIPRDIIIGDWHYLLYDRYPSVERYADNGFHIVPSFYNIPDAAHAFIEHAKKHDRGHVLGMLLTTWCSYETFAEALDATEIADKDLAGMITIARDIFGIR